MKTGVIVLTLAFILGPSDVRANMVIGAGAQSCGIWLAEKNEIVRNTNISWVLGYLSGVNAMSVVDFLKGYEWNGIAAAIDKYCRENPLKDVNDAANDVSVQMLKAKLKK